MLWNQSNQKIAWMTISLAAITLFACVISGCERPAADKPQTTAAPAVDAGAALPADLFVDKAPADARNVAEVRAEENRTGLVVVRGRIGGRAAPFVDGAAIFVLTDASLPPCNELPGDGCRTPWDYCCEPAEKLQAHTATVQIVDAQGKPLRLDLEGQHGLEPLATIIVTGEAAPTEPGGPLVINARSIYVEPTM